MRLSAPSLSQAGTEYPDAAGNPGVMTANKSTGDALSVQILRLLSIGATSNLPTSLGIDQAQRLTVHDRREPQVPTDRNR
jgi:hypothetical protein